MTSRSIKRFTQRLFLTLGSGLLLATPLQLLVIPESSAAPAGMGMGRGTPAQCDAALVISAVQNLQFGKISAPTAGTVTIDTTGLRTATGGIILLSSGTVSAASFTLSTAPTNCRNRRLRTVSVATPAILTDGTNNITLDTFTTNPVANDRFDPAVPLLVGGTIHVGTLQTPGTYTGNILVTVTFQ